MIYLPSKIKYKYVAAFGILVGQILFMTYIHRNNLFDQVSNLVILDNKKIPHIYQELISNITPQKFVTYDKAEKCLTYFDELMELNEHWEISDLNELDYSLDVLSPHDYYERKYEELKQSFIRDGKDVSDIDSKEIMTDLNTKLTKNELVEDRIASSVAHLRVYGTCYINDDTNAAHHPHCSDLEVKLFPWLTFESPIFERWDGTVLTDYPRIFEYYRYEGEGDLAFIPSKTDDSTCLLSNLKRKINGKGIVLSIGDHLVEEAIKFLKALRFMDNKLPIQFVHKGDLSKANKDLLIKAARSSIIIQGIDQFLGADTKQEVWFVDTARCLQTGHSSKFYTFRNKWLAVLFNSFEETLLMDTDVVSFIKPENYFKFKGYRRSGSFFFRDRETGQTFREASKELLLKLLPRDVESLFFGIPKATSFTLDNKFFQNRAYHYMESGVVVINRKTRLLGLLISTQLQAWNPVALHTHGDKELFWLGQSFAGNEGYYFNPNPAGAVGKINKKEYKHSDVIVGVQPAHLGPDNETLLWVNSGLETCKKHTWEFDFSNKLPLSAGFESEEDLQSYYLSPLTIEGVIIPPDAADSFPNNENEPEKGWRQLEHDGCDGYYWGAYSQVGGSTHKKNPASVGSEHSFDQESRDLFKMMGKVWSNNNFYYNELEEPDDRKVGKCWKILEMFGSVDEYEKKLNEQLGEDTSPRKWDDDLNDSTLLIEPSG